jgi:hypothetical protein
MRSKSRIAFNGKAVYCSHTETYRNVHLEVLDTSHLFRSAINRPENSLTIDHFRTSFPYHLCPFADSFYGTPERADSGMKAKCEV